MTDEIISFMKLIENYGHSIYIVGGSVRDFLRGVKPTDYDLASSLKPDGLISLLSNRPEYLAIETGVKYGTVTVILPSGQKIEVTTYRNDGEYNDNRHPESVDFTDNILADLKRRDFTMNAIAWHYEKGITDPFGGKNDIENKLIRAVGEPNVRLVEDALRIMRAVRFASSLGFAIEEETKKAIYDNRFMLMKISPERFRKEIKQLLFGENVTSVLLKYHSILSVLIKEIDFAYSTEHENRFHIYNIWEHCVRTVSAVPKDEKMRLAMLFHDLGKPQVKAFNNTDGEAHYKGHQEVSERIARDTLRRLKYPNEVINDVSFLVKNHDIRPKINRISIKKLMYKFGAENAKRILMVHIADDSAKADFVQKNVNPDYEKGILEIDDILEKNECYNLQTLAVNGNDLIKFCISGQLIAKTLNFLVTEVIEGKLPNERDVLLKYINNNLLLR